MSQKTNSPRLTPRQQQVLEIIKETIATHGYPPTRVEIAQRLGFRSPNAAEDHLRALAKKGVIELISGTSRGIRLAQLASASPSSLAAKAARKSRASGNKGSKTHRAAPTRATTITDVVGTTHPSKQKQAANNPISLCTLAVIGRVAAGSPVLATEHIEKELTVGAHLFQNPPDYLLRVRGLSMRDAGILEGDLLAVKKTTEARSGQIVVARLGDEVTVKRLETTPKGIILHAENPDYKSIHVQSNDLFELEGVAVGLIRDWN